MKASDSPITKKLLIKPGYRVLVMNAPDGYTSVLTPLPEGASVSTLRKGTFDLVLLFVHSLAELNTHAQKALAVVKSGGLFWIAYPKKTSKIKSDVNRDCGWAPVEEAGWSGIAMVSLDDTWAIMRFRPIEDIGK